MQQRIGVKGEQVTTRMRRVSTNGRDTMFLPTHRRQPPPLTLEAIEAILAPLAARGWDIRRRVSRGYGHEEDVRKKGIGLWQVPNGVGIAVKNRSRATPPRDVHRDAARIVPTMYAIARRLTAAGYEASFWVSSSDFDGAVWAHERGFYAQAKEKDAARERVARAQESSWRGVA